MIKIEKATYSYAKVYQACDLVKGLSTSCKRKVIRFSLACEMRKVSEQCYDLTGCSLFQEDWNHALEDYYNATYDCQAHTKTELDHKAKRALRYLQNELDGILTMMHNGEVNVSDDVINA